MKHLYLLLIPVLIHILYTDFKLRKVNLISLLLALIISVFGIVNSLSFPEYLYVGVLNIIITTIIFSVILIYSKLRQLEFSKSLGWGDIILMLIAALNFSPVNFMLFISISSFTGLVFYVVQNFQSKEITGIPFAGIMAVILSIEILTGYIFNYSGYHDLILINTHY